LARLHRTLARALFQRALAAWLFFFLGFWQPVVARVSTSAAATTHRIVRFCMGKLLGLGTR
jgi:hypothetical protein